MDVRMISYTEIDGIPTLKDSEVKGIFKRIEEDGLVSTVFYDGSVKNEDDFLMTMKHKQAHMFLVLIDNVAAGIFWLTDFEAKSASVHYCFFKSHWGKALVEAGKQCISEILNMQDDGEYLFDVLKGITPETNRAALIWDKKIGVSFLGTMPSLCYIEEEQISVPGVIVYVERGLYG